MTGYPLLNLFINFLAMNELTINDCHYIFGIYNNENIFYEFYDKIDNLFIKQKIEQFILNPFIINKNKKEMEGEKEREYIEDQIIEGDQVKQKHTEFFNEAKLKLKKKAHLQFKRVINLTFYYETEISEEDDFVYNRVKKISLTELTVLILILKEISIENLNMYENVELIKIIKDFTKFVLEDRANQFDEFFGKEFYNNLTEEISIFGYAEAYDIFEVKANLFMEEFKKSDYFRVYQVQIIYDGYIIANPELVINECKKVTIGTLEPNILKPKVPFYIFYYKLPKETKDKLQQTIINNYFINKFIHGITEYIDKDLIELIPLSKKLPLAPPQMHLKLVKEVKF
uniref:Uncharacterized protein n=1 Tax=Meloidogyne hapla TaxID=6305 RepID=A0A1I8B4I6_MELHA